MHLIVILLLIEYVVSTKITTTDTIELPEKQIPKQRNSTVQPFSTIIKCGTYEEENGRQRYFLLTSGVIFYGEEGKEPTKMVNYESRYQVKGSKFPFEKVSTIKSIKYKEGNTYDTKIEDIRLIYAKDVIRQNGCINVNEGEEFSVQNTTCTVNDEDRLQEYKIQIGTLESSIITFNETTVIIDGISWPRTNNEGCFTKSNTDEQIKLPPSVIVSIILVISALIGLFIAICMKYVVKNKQANIKVAKN